MENVVFDMADFDACVFCCWSVLEQGLEPRRCRKQQHLMSVKRFPLHQEGDIRHLFVVQEVGIQAGGLFLLDLCQFGDGERSVALREND